MDRSEKADADFVRGAGYKPKRKKYGGRKKGVVNKRTEQKIAAAQHEVSAALRGNKKIAIDHMDDMIDYFRQLVALHQPWQADGSKREGKDDALWFRCVDAFRDFLALRAPYQSSRLSHMAVMPTQARQRTVVNVTILNEHGEKVWSDMPADAGEDAVLIEHDAEDAA